MKQSDIAIRLSLSAVLGTAAVLKGADPSLLVKTTTEAVGSESVGQHLAAAVIAVEAGLALWLASGMARARMSVAVVALGCGMLGVAVWELAVGGDVTDCGCFGAAIDGTLAHVLRFAAMCWMVVGGSYLYYRYRQLDGARELPDSTIMPRLDEPLA